MSFTSYKTYILNTFQEYQKKILFTIILFILGIIIGAMGIANTGLLSQVINEKFTTFKQLEGIELTLGIFLNNLQAAAIAFYVGIFFAIIPVFLAFGNGLIVGMVLSMSPKSLYILLPMLIPHGIFELPAIFLSAAMGIKLGSWILQENPWEFIKEQLNEGTMVLIRLLCRCFSLRQL